MADAGFRFDGIPILPGAAPSPEPAPPAVVEPPRALDRWARLHWDRGRRIGSYFAFGCVGFVVGLAAVLLFARATAAPRAVTVAVAVAVPLGFLLGVKLSQILFGRERIVFFEQALFALGLVALALVALGL